ncbi:MAG: STAS domain-containing protein [Ardenticatenaceae bacterium]
MPSEPLTTTVRQNDGVALIDLRGEINGFADDTLSAAYTEAEQGDPPVIVLNFRDVDYINSTGIALIVGLLAKARQAHRRLLVYGLSPHYQEIFTITRLSDFMSIFPDEASAMAGAER